MILKLFIFFYMIMTVTCDRYVIFFFLYQQFITWLVEEDRGSYFRNYVQRKQTNMKLKKRKRKRK